jgi:membrane protein YdbS with pleckstrin-like domain
MTQRPRIVAHGTSEVGAQPPETLEVAAGQGYKEEASDERLSDQARLVWRIESTFTAVATAAVDIFLFAVWPDWGPGSVLMYALLSMIAAGLFLDFIFIIPKRYAYYSFRMSPAVVTIDRGALVRSRTVLPTDKILYIRLSRGPITSAFGMAKVKFGTIGEPISLGPLPEARAVQIQNDIGLEDDTRKVT